MNTSWKALQTVQQFFLIKMTHKEEFDDISFHINICKIHCKCANLVQFLVCNIWFDCVCTGGAVLRESMFSQCGWLLDLKERVSYFQQVCQKVKLLHFIVDHLSVVIRVALCSYNIFLHGIMTLCFFQSRRFYGTTHRLLNNIFCTIYVFVLHSCMFQAVICVLWCVFHALCVLRG